MRSRRPPITSSSAQALVLTEVGDLPPEIRGDMATLTKRQVGTLALAALLPVTTLFLTYLFGHSSNYAVYETAELPSVIRVDGDPVSVLASTFASEVSVASARGVRSVSASFTTGPTTRAILLQGVRVRYGRLLPHGLEGLELDNLSLSD